MNYCFLNRVYDSGERKVYELVQFSSSDFLNHTIVYSDVDQLQQIYNSNQFVTDFRLNEGFLMWDGDTVTIEDSLLVKVASGGPRRFTNVLPGLYEKLVELSRLDARYISDEFVPKLAEGRFPREGVAAFSSLRISQSTMRLSLSIMTEEGWRARSIVGYEGGLQFHPFRFLIESEKEHEMLPSDFVVRESYHVLSGVEFALYRVNDGLPIYPEMAPSFRLVDPMLNQKMFLYERNRCVINLLKLFKTRAERELYPAVQEEEHEEKQPYEHHEAPDRRGVFMKFGRKQPTYVELEGLYKKSFEIFRYMGTNGLTMEQGLERMRSFYVFNEFELFAVYTLVRVLRSASSSANWMDSIDTARETINLALKENVNLGLSLFAVRAYITLTNFRFTDNTENHFLRGGLSSRQTEIKKVGI